MSGKDLVQLFKSGDFTIAYHDNGVASVYKGKHKNYDSLPEKEVHQFDCDTDGYLPKEVKLLTEALGGKSHSI